MASKGELREPMVVRNERKKELLKKRNSLLQNQNSVDKENALKITHEIAKLLDFIRTSENILRMSD